MHIDLYGNLISLKDQKFVYIPGKNVMEVEISTPFTSQPMKDIMLVKIFELEKIYSLLFTVAAET